MNREELLVYVQRVIDSKYAGLQVAFAQYNELSAAYVNDVLRGRREPGKKILDAVGVERITVYRPKGNDLHHGWMPNKFGKFAYIPRLKHGGFTHHNP